MGTWRSNLREQAISGDAAFMGFWGFPPTNGPRPYAEFLARMSPQGRDLMAEMIARTQIAGEVIDGEHAVVGGPTAGRWVRWRGCAERERPWIVNGICFDVTNQRRSEERLRESEARHRLLIENLAQAVWETDSAGVVVTDSPSWRAYTGQTLDAWLGCGWLDAIHPDDRAYAERQWREAISTRSLVSGEFRLRAPGGEWRWTNVLAAPVLDEKGEIEKWAGLNIDIDVRKRAEVSLRESEERQAFFLKLSDALRPLVDPLEIKRVATRLLGKHLGVNRAFYADASPDGDHWLVAKGFEEGVESLPEAPFPMATYGQWIIEDFRGGKTLAVRDMDTDPRFSEAERAAQQSLQIKAAVAVPLVKAETLVAMLVLHRAKPREWAEQDFAVLDEAAERTWAAVERARAEAALRESEERYRGLFERIDEGFSILELLYDDAGNAFDAIHLEANPAHARHSGVEGIVGKRVFEVLPPDEARYWIAFYDEVTRTGQANRIESEIAGIDRWVTVHVSRLGGADSRKVAVVFNDITERKRAEADLRESEERQRFLLALSDALRAQADPAEIERTALESLAEKLGLDRAHITRLDPDGDRAVVGAEAARGLPSVIGVHRPSAFPETFRTMVDATLVSHDMRTDPMFGETDRRSLDAVQMISLVVVSLRKGPGRVVWSLACAMARPRQWAVSEVMLIEDAAERIWAAVERARAETALRESESRFRQFADASTNILWIRDAATFRMAFASPAFTTIYGRACDAVSGDSGVRCWAKMIVPEDRRRVLNNLRRIRAGERVEQEYRIRRGDTGELRWIHNTDFALFDADGSVSWVAGLGMDITAAKEAAERQGVLVAELQHRTRNLIGVVRSLSDRTIDSASSMEDFGRRFALRLAALSRVQGLLSHLAAGERVAFDELLRAELAAHGATDGIARKVTLDGPSGVPLRSSTVQTFALALHELATNAVKYGALAAANPDGHLTVRWHVEPAIDRASPRLHVEWRESGVIMPEVNAPPRGGGYGRELIERALPYQLKAKTSYELGADGVRCTIAVPIAGGGVR